MDQPRPDTFLNGRFLTRSEAELSAFDAGFQHAVGLFETMTAVNAGSPDETDAAETDSHVDIIHVDWHMQRLAASASELGLTEALDVRGLQEAAYLTVEKSGLCDAPGSRARVRLTVTGGDLSMLNTAAARDYSPTVLIQVQPATPYPPEMFEQGVLVTIAQQRANPFDPMNGHKTLNYWGKLRELQQAGAVGAAEALNFSISNHLACGCVSNIFIVKDGTVATPIARGEEQRIAGTNDDGTPKPALPSPVLPGVTRRFIMEQCAEQNIDLRVRMITAEELLEADEVFLTNSSWGVLPVRAIEGNEIGEPGAVTKKMRDAWEGRLSES